MRRHFHTELLEDPHDDGAHADRWILSYADFITLLFAFFVVMYSISSVNDGKFRVLSASLLEVFQDPRVNAAIEERCGLLIIGVAEFVESNGPNSRVLPDLRVERGRQWRRPDRSGDKAWLVRR